MSNDIIYYDVEATLVALRSVCHVCFNGKYYGTPDISTVAQGKPYAAALVGLPQYSSSSPYTHTFRPSSYSVKLLLKHGKPLCFSVRHRHR